MVKLELAIATHGREGIGKVAEMLLPPMADIGYVISWQNHKDAPVPEELLARKDVKIFRFDETGLSRNRNNAFDKCEAPIVLFSDDDLKYYPEGLREVIKTFSENPSLDIALFRIEQPSSEKIYPADSSPVTLPFPKGYWVGGPEIAFRRESVADLRCYPEIGPGAPEMLTGEDEFFVISAIRRKLSCRFINHTICSHPSVSTGSQVSPGVLLGQGFLIGCIYPVSGLVRGFIKAWRLKRAGKTGFFEALVPLLKGVGRTRRQLRKISPRFRW